MRTYGHREGESRPSSSYQRRTDRRDREAREWDLRIDVNDQLTPDAIRIALLSHRDELEYYMVSGVEFPDTESVGYNKAYSKDTHVHIGLISRKPIKRGEALALCRGIRKLTDEYAVPRNQRYPYAGWVAHHSKPAYKQDDQPGLLVEWGTLPMDSYDEAKLKQVVRLLDKFGSDDIKERFKHYYDALKLTNDLKLPVELVD